MLDEKLLALNESWMELQAELRNKNRILLCMDESDYRERLTELATADGFDVAVTETASDAAKSLEREEVDLLTVAEEPPDMSALALVRFARGRPVTPKVIVLAQSPTPRKVLEAIQLGVSDYLLEPEQAPEEVHERARRRLEQLSRQKLQLRMISDLRHLHQQTPPEERAVLVMALQGRLERFRSELGPMNRVLVADIDTVVGRQLCAALGGLGIHPMEALGGNSALTLIAGEGADLVVLSGSLPDLSVEQMLLEIQDVSDRLPVILLASVNEVDTALTALRRGFADCIRKPIAAPEQAAHRVARVLRDHRRDRLAEHLIRELYRLTRSATETIKPEAAAAVDGVFDDMVVLPMDEATEPMAAAGDDGAVVTGSHLPSDTAGDALVRNPFRNGLPMTTQPLRLASGDVEILKEGETPQVSQAGYLPDTEVIRYIDDLLVPAGGGRGPWGPPGSGQRLTPRVERSTFVRYGATGTEQASLGYSHDLSLGGMFILSPHPPPIGTDLQIELQLQHEDQVERIRVQGRVMWHTNPERSPPQGDGFGVQFTVVDPRASQALLRAITT